MSKKDSKLLVSFNKANKQRKIKLAAKAGYADYEEYRKLLKQGIAVDDALKNTSNKTTKPTIHIVDILDCSTSMAGDKIRAANNAIAKSLIELKKIKEVNYLYTLCHFSSGYNINTSFLKTPIQEVNFLPLRGRGMTALYQAIVETLQKVSIKGDKVLVNIYTDGQENDSDYHSRKTIKKVLKDLENTNYTITFIGTEYDVANIIDDLGIIESNTLSYDGTGKGLEKAMKYTSVARSVYTNKVIKGQDVSQGFYKDIITK